MEITQDYFSTIGVGVSRLYCTNNKFNADLYNYCTSRLKLIDFMGTLKLNGLDHLALKDIKVTKGKTNAPYNLSAGLVRSAQREMQSMGIDLEETFYQTHFRFLTMVYLMTSLCIMFVKRKDKPDYITHFITKNDVVLKAMEQNGRLPQGMSVDNMKASSIFTITDAEIDANKLRVVKLSRASASRTFKPSLTDVYANHKSTIILPYHMIYGYTTSVIERLKSNCAEITYVDGSNQSTVVATLSKPAQYNRAVRAASIDPSKLVVYDYNTDDEVVLDVIRIMGIRPLKQA